MRTDWKPECEALLRAIAPSQEDLDDRPVYLLTEHDLPGGASVECYGCTSGLMDLNYRRRLEATGRWRGRGFACLVCEKRIRAEMVEEDRVARSLLHVVLHEFAHWLTWSALHVGPLANWPGADSYDWGKGLARDHREPVTIAPPSALKPWDGHDLDFTRAACHVAERARRAGGRASINHMCVGGDYYGISYGFQYEIDLDEEIRARCGEPIREILASAAPAVAQARFESDVKDFEERNQHACCENQAA